MNQEGPSIPAARPAVFAQLQNRFGAGALVEQETPDHLPTLWTSRDLLPGVVRHLQSEVPLPYRMLFDLTAIDERTARVLWRRPYRDPLRGGFGIHSRGLTAAA
ncbi:MAG: hypothetical protein ACYC8T_29895 [Myxococcaceae bacterium]